MLEMWQSPCAGPSRMRRRLRQSAIRQQRSNDLFSDHRDTRPRQNQIQVRRNGVQHRSQKIRKITQQDFRRERTELFLQAGKTIKTRNT